MKKTLLFVLIILAFANQLFAQTIRRVNNSPSVSGVNIYTTIQAAHDAATAGDIIYVEPTGISAGGLACSKTLTIVGNGYFLSLNPNTPASKSSSIIDGVTFQAGSENSIITGMDISGGGSNVRSPNVTITRCRIGTINLHHEHIGGGVYSIPNNLTVSKCLLTANISYGSAPDGLNVVATGHIISNNIFSIGGGHGIDGLLNTIIVNNTFLSTLGGTGGGPIDGIIYNVANTSITNNIFDFRSAHANANVFSTSNAAIYTSNTLSNNISLAQSGLPVGNGNVNGASETTTFQVENPWLLDTFGRGYFDKDATYQLAVNSPAKAIGTGGTDAGAFGGASPYVLSGLAPYPIITNFTTSGAGNTSLPLQVSVSVRSNN